MELEISPESFFAKGIQIYCVEYPRGSFVQMSATCCIEILHGLSNAHCFYVVVRKLQSFLAKNHYQMEAPIWRKDNPCSFYFDARGAYAFCAAKIKMVFGFYVNPRHQETAEKTNVTGGEHPKTMSTSMFSKMISIAKNPFETLSSLSGHLAPT